MPPKRKTDGDRRVPPSNAKKAKLFDEKELIFIDTSVVETPWIPDHFSGPVWTPPEAPFPSPLAPSTTSKVARAIYDSNLSRSSQSAVGALYSRFKQAGNIHRTRLGYRKGFGNDEKILVTQLEKYQSNDSTQSGLLGATFYQSGDAFELNDGNTTATIGESAIIECHTQGAQTFWFLRFVQPLKHLRINHVLYNFNGRSGIIGPLPEFTIVQSLSQAKFIFTSYAGLRCAPRPALLPPNVFDPPVQSCSLAAPPTELTPDKSTSVEAIYSTAHDNSLTRDKACQRADSPNIVLQKNSEPAAPKIDTSLQGNKAPSSFASVSLGEDISHEVRPSTSRNPDPLLSHKQASDGKEVHAKTEKGMQAPIETATKMTQPEAKDAANPSPDEALLQTIFPKEVCEIITAAATEAIKANNEEKEKRVLKERRERMDKALKAQKDFEDDMAKLKAKAEAVAAHAIMLRGNQLRAAEERIRKQKESGRAEQEGITTTESQPVSAPAVVKKIQDPPPTNASKGFNTTATPNKSSEAGRDVQLNVDNVSEQTSRPRLKPFPLAKSRGSIANARLDYFENKTRPEDAGTATSTSIPTSSVKQVSINNNNETVEQTPSAHPSSIPILEVSSAPDLPSLSSSLSQKGSSSPQHSSSSVTLHGTKDRETCRAHPKTVPSNPASTYHHSHESLFTNCVDSVGDSNTAHPNVPLNPPGFRFFPHPIISQDDSVSHQDDHTQTKSNTQNLVPKTPASPVAAVAVAVADNDNCSASSTRANASATTSTNGDEHEHGENKPTISSPTAALPIPGLGLLAPPPPPSTVSARSSYRTPSPVLSEHSDKSDDMKSLFEE